MKDDAILRELRDAAKRADQAKLGDTYDAPLGDAFEARAAARIVEEQRAARPARARSILRAPRLWAAIAIAAAMALLVAQPWRERAGDPLPRYEIAIAGGVDATRGEAPAALAITARPGDDVTVSLHPATDVEGPIDVAVFAMRGAEAHRVTPAVRVAPSGAVEIRGAARDLVGDAPGESRIVVAIARTGALPAARDVARGTIGAGVAVGRVVVRVIP